MNVRTIALSVALLLNGSTLWAAPVTEYKCSVTLANGQDAIMFAEGATVEQARARLTETPARSRYDKRKAAAKLHECVRVHERFRDAHARALDDITPR